MLGIVFTSFIEHMESSYGPDVTDKVLDKVGSDGAYTVVGYYDNAELISMAVALSDITGRTGDNILRDFGIALFESMKSQHKNIIDNIPSFFELVTNFDEHLREEVRKLYPEAELPVFEIAEKSSQHIYITYQSGMQFSVLAEGVIYGAAKHYGVKIKVTRTPCDDGSVFFEVYRA